MSNLPPDFTYSARKSEGASAPARWVGGTASGAPAYGAFQVGDFVIDQTGIVWICTAAGIPGTWENAANNLTTLTTAGDILIENATPAPARLAVGSAGEVLGVSGGLPAWGMGMTLLATTTLTGYTLVNGTGNVISWTAPNDGVMHRVLLNYVFVVTSNETGGQITWTFTAPNNTAVSNANLITASQTAATYKFNPNAALVYPGTTVTVSQFTPLTGGAAVLWMEMWGS